MEFNEGEKINFATGFFSSSFLSFLFLSFVIFGLYIYTLLRMGGGCMSISLTLEISGIILSIGIYFIGTIKSGSPYDIFYMKINLHCIESW